MRNLRVARKGSENIFTTRQCDAAGERCGFDTENQLLCCLCVFVAVSSIHGPIETSSSHIVPKIGHGDESQLLRCNRMTAACEVASVVKSNCNLVQEVVPEGRLSDLPNSSLVSASFTVIVSGAPVIRSFVFTPKESGYVFAGSTRTV